MTKIEKLTPEQEQDLASYRAEIFDARTTPGIREEPAKEAIRNVYRVMLEKEPPERIEVVDGPLAAQKLLKSIDPSLQGVIWPTIYADGWWSSWVAFYTWCGSRLDLDVPYEPERVKQLAAVRAVSEECGWLWTYDEIAVVCPRPTSKWTDDRWDPAAPVLHSADGPAASYPDGFEVYVWRGTRVPKEWIMAPDVLAPEIALTHENLEQRRAAAEIMGWDKILEKLNPTVIDEDDPEIGTLIEVDLPDAGPTRFIRVRCGTGRQFALCVPNNMKTALEANAWTYGLKTSDFAPEVRT